MKVAYLLGSLNRGGAENLILDVFQNSEYAKFDFIGIHRRGGIYEGSFQKVSKTFIHCPISRHKIVSYLHRLRKILLDNEINIAHAQQPIDAVLARIATLGTGIKVVLTVHGFDFNTAVFNRVLKYISLCSSDSVIFVSRYQYDYYRNNYHLRESNKYSVLYNGINFSKFIPQEKKQLTGRIRMGTVGSFRSGRDHFFICKFLNYLKDKGVDFDFSFIGSKIDTEAERYNHCVDYCNRHGLENNVHFLGGCDNVPFLLSQLDAFIYCSEHDTFGIAVIEAIAAGIPVFVNDWDVMSEITNNGKMATLYKTGDIGDLYEKFQTLLNNYDMAITQTGEKAILAREKYSISTHIENLFEHYNKL